MGLEDDVARVKAGGSGGIYVAIDELEALLAERDALKAENAFLKDQADTRKVEITDLVMRSAPSGPGIFTIADIRCIERTYEDRIAVAKAENERLRSSTASMAEAYERAKAEIAPPKAPSGHSCSDRAIVNDRLAALERDVKALQSRDILADQRMDHLDRRIDEAAQLVATLESDVSRETDR